MEHQVIAAFAQGTLSTFRNLCGTELTPRQARHRSELDMGRGVHTIIGLSGTITGATLLSLPEPLACLLVGRALGQTVVMGPEVVDGVGEFANILAGSARKQLEAEGLDFQFALPKTMHGVLMPTDEGPDFCHLGIRFQSADGVFLLHLTWKSLPRQR